MSRPPRMPRSTRLAQPADTVAECEDGLARAFLPTFYVTIKVCTCSGGHHGS
jgi:hypothetical protein